LRPRTPDRRDGLHPHRQAIAELHRTGGRYAIVTMCIGGGQGIAGMFERI
jgi:acetyl-CoA acetyltransferase